MSSRQTPRPETPPKSGNAPPPPPKAQVVQLGVKFFGVPVANTVTEADRK